MNPLAAIVIALSLCGIAGAVYAAQREARHHRHLALTTMRIIPAAGDRTVWQRFRHTSERSFVVAYSLGCCPVLRGLHQL